MLVQTMQIYYMEHHSKCYTIPYMAEPLRHFSSSCKRIFGETLCGQQQITNGLDALVRTSPLVLSYRLLEMMDL